MFDKPHVVIENGTEYCKAGFSGEEKEVPETVIPLLGDPNQTTAMISMLVTKQQRKNISLT